MKPLPLGWGRRCSRLSGDNHATQNRLRCRGFGPAKIGMRDYARVLNQRASAMNIPGARAVGPANRSPTYGIQIPKSWFFVLGS